MSLQILQKPLNSLAEETKALESLFENAEYPPEIETLQQDSNSWEACPEPFELETEIIAGTHQQVQNLKVRCDHSGITVEGVSSSYYLKQLVTQTVQTCAPSIPLMNRVLVQTAQ